MDLTEIEHLAEATLSLANCSTSLPPLALAKRLGLSVYTVPGMRPRGWLAEVDGAPTIAIRASLKGCERAFTVAHELGHWAVQRFGVKPDSRDDEERLCNAFAACVLMPRRAFAGALTELEFHHVRNLCLGELSAKFSVTEAGIALRVGELTGLPLAVITPVHVYARGTWQCPDESTVRQWSRTGRPGFRRAKLGDSRAVLLVASAA